MANEYVYRQSGDQNISYQEDGHFESTGLWGFGWDKDPGFDNRINGALRIANLPINRGTWIYSADIVMENCSRRGESIWGDVYGIDEDNTGELGGNPFTREKTSEHGGIYMYQPSGNTGFGVGGIVQEIINRGGWNYNNAIGFMWITNDLSNHGAQSNYILSLSGYLYIRFAPEPNFKPTPQALTSAAFPAVDSIGIKISKTGVSVLTASEADTYFTTRKQVMTVKDEALITTVANPHNIAHGLGYTPMVTAFALGADGKQHLLPRVNYGAGGSIGWVGADSTYVRFYVPIGTQIYYYIFHDPQPV